MVQETTTCIRTTTETSIPRRQSGRKLGVVGPKRLTDGGT